MNQTPSQTLHLLGKHRDLWKDIDAVEYIRNERKSSRDDIFRLHYSDQESAADRRDRES